MSRGWAVLAVLLTLGASIVKPGSANGGALRECARVLSSGSAAERATAVWVLGRLGGEEAVKLLIRALSDESPAVRAEAARALARLKDRRAIGALVKAIKDEDPNVRMFAAYALGELGDERAVDALVGSLADESWLVREFAAWALRRIGAPKAARPLVKLLERKKADVGHIAWALSGLKDKEEVVGLLARLLKSGSEAARARAALVLGRLKEPGAVGPLCEALSDGSPKVRLEAVRALEEIGRPEAIEPLKALLKRERERAVREAIEKALAELEFERFRLVAYWNFEKVTGDVVEDATGNENAGALLGGRLVRGKVGRALKLDGRGYVDIGRPKFSIANQPLTVMAWVRPEAENGVVVVYGGAWCGFTLYVKDGLPKFGIHRRKDGPAYVVSGRERIVGRWAHLAGVVRKDRIELYVDGKLVAEKEIPGLIPGDPGQGMQIGFDLGDSPAEITDHFVGLLDEVKVFLKALSPEEIAEGAGLRRGGEGR